jgi:hypothetical protein
MPRLTKAGRNHSYSYLLMHVAIHVGNLQRNQRIGASAFGLANDLGGIYEEWKTEDR